MRFGPQLTVKFRDGTKVRETKYAKYLGCMLNSRGNAQGEVNQRIAAAGATWKELDAFWKHSGADLKLNLQAYIG